MNIRVADANTYVTHVHTRVPFRYGIAEMTVAPHVVLTLEVRAADGHRAQGIASEQLPPAWFTKNPGETYADEIRGMVAVISSAVEAAVGRSSDTAFGLWWGLQHDVSQSARDSSTPGLLSGLGVALVERALLDAVCRLAGVPFAGALRSGLLGFRPSLIHPELADGMTFSAPPRETLAVRQTVGLADPLRDAEVVDDPRDGLPVSLEASMRRYGLDHLKVKTKGDAEADIDRLRDLFALADELGTRISLTIDGNESMRSSDHFTEWIGALQSSATVGARLRDSLIAVEQPFHRDVAFSHEVEAALRATGSDALVIIDESDDSLEAVRLAMDMGYSGGTYKGCKGVFRGLANALLVQQRSSQAPAILTAEDLATLPPLTLNQDLVVAATMGLTHIERNGHHFFGCLAPITPTIDEIALRSHPELFEAGADGRAHLAIHGGALQVSGALAAPFGFAADLDVSHLTALSEDSALVGVGDSSGRAPQR